MLYLQRLSYAMRSGHSEACSSTHARYRGSLHVRPALPQRLAAVMRTGRRLKHHDDNTDSPVANGVLA